jgi:hypothetical protein
MKGELDVASEQGAELYRLRDLLLDSGRHKEAKNVLDDFSVDLPPDRVEKSHLRFGPGGSLSIRSALCGHHESQAADRSCATTRRMQCSKTAPSLDHLVHIRNTRRHSHHRRALSAWRRPQSPL